MFTVVDAGNFTKDFGSWEVLSDRRIGLGEDDDRNIVDLLVDQVEFANVIIVNKTDLVSLYELEQLNRILRQLNANAKILNHFLWSNYFVSYDENMHRLHHASSTA